VKEKIYFDLVDPFWVNWFGFEINIILFREACEIGYLEK